MRNLTRRLADLEASTRTQASDCAVMVVFVDRHHDGHVYDYDGILFYGDGRHERINGPWRLSSSFRTARIATALQGANAPDLYR